MTYGNELFKPILLFNPLPTFDLTVHYNVGKGVWCREAGYNRRAATERYSTIY